MQWFIEWVGWWQSSALCTLLKDQIRNIAWKSSQLYGDRSRIKPTTLRFKWNVCQLSCCNTVAQWAVHQKSKGVSSIPTGGPNSCEIFHLAMLPVRFYNKWYIHYSRRLPTNLSNAEEAHKAQTGPSVAIIYIIYHIRYTLTNLPNMVL